MRSADRAERLYFSKGALCYNEGKAIIHKKDPS
jgi:hypothetical protein